MSSKFSSIRQRAQDGDALKLPICKLESRPMTVRSVLYLPLPLLLPAVHTPNPSIMQLSSEAIANTSGMRAITLHSISHCFVLKIKNKMCPMCMSMSHSLNIQ